MTEYLRPWKLATFALGLAVLLIGGHIEQLPDWTPPVSVTMALLTYLTAPWAVRVFIERRWTAMPGALFAAWFTVNMAYSAFQILRPISRAELHALQDANWPTSACLYLLCGLLWMYRGSLKDFSASLRAALESRPSLHR